MRKLTLALAIGLLAATTGFVLDTPKARAAGVLPKVVIVVGATEEHTQDYRNDADSLALAFAPLTTNITKIYSPNATWGAVKAAAKDANILVYLGHGSGWPNPYGGSKPYPLQPMGDNGMGLNSSAAGTDYNKKYYGESYMAQLELAPNALVLLNHLCYASGNNDSAYGGNPTLDVAKKRVEGYAAGFLKAGAGAVLAEGNYLTDFVTRLSSHTTIDAAWRLQRSYNHVYSWADARNPGATASINPDGGTNPSYTGYYSSLVQTGGVTTDQIISGVAPVFTPGSGSYYPINPTVRLVDSRLDHVGPTGKLAANGVVNYKITGGVVPTGAIGITANLTVTWQSSNGALYIAPTIDSSTGLPASTINFPKGDNRANGITVGLSPRGTVAVYYSSGSGQSTDFIIDVTGYFMPGTGGAGYHAFGPVRIMDSRYSQQAVKFVAGHHQTFQIAGVAGLPATGIVAVVGNLTIVKPTVAAYVYLGPNPTDAPTSSTINFPRYDIRANNIIVPVAADGTLSAVYSGTKTGTVDLVLDISGYYTADGGYQFNTLMPSRILDSRTNTPLPGPFPIMVPQQFQVTGHAGVPSGAVALVSNLAGTGATCGGYASIAPDIPSDFRFSNLNYPIRDTRANGATTPLTTDGKIEVIYGGCTGSYTSHLFLDVYGYYLGDA